MQPLGPESRALGPRDARGLQVALGCIGVLSVTVSAVAGIALMWWVYLLHSNPNEPFPTMAPIALALPLASIGFGAWAWHGNKVRRLASGGAIAMGTGSLAIVAMEVFFGFVFLLLSMKR